MKNEMQDRLRINRDSLFADVSELLTLKLMKKIRQRDVHHASGVSRVHLSQMLSGARKVSLDMLSDIATVAGYRLRIAAVRDRRWR